MVSSKTLCSRHAHGSTCLNMSRCVRQTWPALQIFLVANKDIALTFQPKGTPDERAMKAAGTPEGNSGDARTVDIETLASTPSPRGIL